MKRIRKSTTLSKSDNSLLVSERTKSFREQIHASARKRTTEISRQKDWRYVCHWYSIVNNTEYTESITPMRPSDIIDFIHDHLGNMPENVDKKLVSLGIKRKLGPHKVSTILKRLDTIKVMHDATKLYTGTPVIDADGYVIEGNPCRHSEVELEIKVIRKALENAIKDDSSSVRVAAKAAFSQSKKAAQWPIVKRLIDVCDSSAKGLRDKAIFYYSYATGRRRSETANQLLEDVKEVEDGYIITIPPSKQTGYKEVEAYLKGEAYQALREWISLLEEKSITSGRLFRSVAKGGRTIGEGITGTAINKIVKSRLREAGFSEKETQEYSSHSFRSGFSTDCRVVGISSHQARQFSGQSAQTFESYAKDTDVMSNEAVNLIDLVKRANPDRQKGTDNE